MFISEKNRERTVSHPKVAMSNMNAEMFIVLLIMLTRTSLQLWLCHVIWETNSISLRMTYSQTYHSVTTAKQPDPSVIDIPSQPNNLTLPSSIFHHSQKTWAFRHRYPITAEQPDPSRHWYPISAKQSDPSVIDIPSQPNNLTLPSSISHHSQTTWPFHYRYPITAKQPDPSIIDIPSQPNNLTLQSSISHYSQTTWPFHYRYPI